MSAQDRQKILAAAIFALPVLLCQALIFLFVPVWRWPPATYSLIMQFLAVPLAAAAGAFSWPRHEVSALRGSLHGLETLAIFSLAYVAAGAALLGPESIAEFIVWCALLSKLLFQAIGVPLIAGFSLAGYMLGADGVIKK